MTVALNRRLQELTSSSFFTDVAKLASGTTGGRAIMLASLPVISRLYTPEDFSLLAVYFSLISTIAVASCLRLEIAIPLAGTNEDAVNLLVLSILSSLCITLALILPALVIPETTANLIGNRKLAPYLWLVPAGVLISALYSALQYWATRHRRFGSIAKTRLSQATIGSGTMIALGWVSQSPLGLLLGHALNVGAGGLRLGIDVLRRDRKDFNQVSIGKLKTTLNTYRRYPIYSTPEALANIAGAQIPIIIIAARSETEAGFLFFSMQIMAAPLVLLGTSVSQVYMSRAPDELQAGRLSLFTLHIIKRLIQVSVGPLMLAAIIAPFIIPLIFGENWTRAGEIIPWLMPWVSLQFIVSPVSMALHITDNQQLAMRLQFLGFFLRVGVVLAVMIVDSTYLTAAFIAASFAFYALYISVVIRVSEISFPKFWQTWLAGLYSALPWVLIGVLFFAFMSFLS